MNERIQELAEQAGFQRTKFGLVATPESNPVKFAELIVKECAHIAEVYQADDRGWNIDEIIKEHFGLE